MQYMLLIYNNEAGMQAAPAGAIKQMSAAYESYTEALMSAGVLKAGDRLRPTSDATTVRVANGKTPGARRSLRRDQGAARRLLPDRRARSRRGALVGGEAARAPRSARSKCGRSGRCRWLNEPSPDCSARCRRRRRAPQLRQAGRLSVGAHARRRGRRGCAIRGVRGRARGLAGERHSGQSRSLADGGRTAASAIDAARRTADRCRGRASHPPDRARSSTRPHRPRATSRTSASR